jgi:hypothetical protein
MMGCFIGFRGLPCKSSFEFRHRRNEKPDINPQGRVFPSRLKAGLRNPTHISPFIFLTILAVFGCAKIQAPPGGPQDRTPPKIVATVPITGAVDVDRLAPLRIEFSEPIIKDKLHETIYISPRPPTEPEFGGGKKTIEIRWPDSLAENVTYLVTIATQITDQRRNRLAEPYLLAFSTGPAIDSGTIVGVVFDGGKPVANAQVMLFALPLDSANAVFASPDYITECGPDGACEFAYLPAGAYRAIAAVDKNKNRSIDIGEKAGVGAFDIKLTPEEHRSPLLYLYLRDSDTTRFELSGCRVDQDRVLNVTFSHEVDSLSLGTAEWSVTPIGESEPPRIVYIAPDIGEKTVIRFLIAEVEIGVSYRLSVGGLLDHRGKALDTLYNTAEFFWPSAPDTNAPEIANSLPGAGATEVDPAGEFHLWFSEPVDTAKTAESFYVADSTGRRVPGSVEWPGPWEMVFSPDTELAGGMQYLLVLDSGMLVDGAGNSSGDRWATGFITIEPNDFGSVVGSLSVARAAWLELPILVEFIAVEYKAHSLSLTSSGSESFLFDLPADRYTVRVTVDLNRNGRFDRGTVMPYTLAEPRFLFPDEIEVRARFTTEGVALAIP